MDLVLERLRVSRPAANNATLGLASTARFSLSPPRKRAPGSDPARVGSQRPRAGAGRGGRPQLTFGKENFSKLSGKAGKVGAVDGFVLVAVLETEPPNLALIRREVAGSCLGQAEGLYVS